MRRMDADGQAVVDATPKTPLVMPNTTSKTSNPPAVSSGTLNIKLDDGDRWIVEWIAQNGSVQTPVVAEALGISRATALRRLNALCDRGILVRDGKPRSPRLSYLLA